MIAVLLSIFAVASIAWSACPSGFDPWSDDFCGFLDTSRGYTFNGSYNRCTFLGARMPSIHNLTENKKIRDATGSYEFWLGLGCHDDLRYSWTDNTTADFLHLYDDQDFAECNEQYRYVMLPEGNNFGSKWLRAPQNTIYATVCVIPKTFDAECDDSLSNNGSKCLQFFKKPLTWTKAELQCTINDGHLLSIHSVLENNFVRRSAVANGVTSAIHIGLTNANSKSQCIQYLPSTPSSPFSTTEEFATTSPFIVYIVNDFTVNAIDHVSSRDALPSSYGTCPGNAYPDAGKQFNFTVEVVQYVNIPNLQLYHYGFYGDEKGNMPVKFDKATFAEGAWNDVLDFCISGPEAEDYDLMKFQVCTEVEADLLIVFTAADTNTITPFGTNCLYSNVIGVGINGSDFSHACKDSYATVTDFGDHTQSQYIACLIDAVYDNVRGSVLSTASPVHPVSSWTWTDDTPIDYRPGNPNTDAGSCMQMSTKDGTWTSVDCSVTAPFFCEYGKQNTKQ